MGKVHFHDSQPVRHLSGTLAGVTYRTDAGGNTFAFVSKRSSVPVINECIDIIQSQQMDNHPCELQQIADRRNALYHRVKRLYNRYKDHPLLREDTDKLRDAILLAYRQERKN